MSRATLDCLFAIYDRLWCHIVGIGNAGTRFLLWGKSHVFVFRLREFEEPCFGAQRPSQGWRSGSVSGECGGKDCSLSVSLRSCWLPLFPLP